VEQLSDEITKEIRSIPKYPEHLIQLENLLHDKDTPFSKVADVIKKDPALTAELLKIVNSAQYYLPQRVNNIQNAVSLIGFRGLKDLLLLFGAQKILSSKYQDLDQMWEHAFHVASFAYNIAKEYGYAKLADDAYIAGILHDMGKIIVRSAKPKLADTLTQFCEERGIHGNAIENLSLGTSHARIGSLVAQKWNFPENLVIPIAFHHHPFLAPDEFIDLVSIVYLANVLVMKLEGRADLSSIDQEILEKFSVTESDALAAMESKLSENYAKQKSKEE